jgi:hypothetical protein
MKTRTLRDISVMATLVSVLMFGVFTAPAITAQNAAPTSAPQAWSPMQDWEQPQNWSILNFGATYLPCSDVAWFFNREGEASSRSKMIETTKVALRMISEKTGLTFTQTMDPGLSELTFAWERSSEEYAGRAGGGFNLNNGEVLLNQSSWWTKNIWRGFSSKYGPVRNGWLIIHEVLHVLGIGHVEDKNEIMNPYIASAKFGPGTISAMNEMYKSQPCPVLPLEVFAS